VPQRVALSDLTIVGKVIKFSDKGVIRPRWPGDTEKVHYQVAIVKVSEGLLAGPDVKEVRVGFVPPPAPGARIVGPMLPGSTLQLGVDQEGIFFLTKEAGTDFYAPAPLGGFVDKTTREFESGLPEARKAGKLLSNPKANLTASNATDRVMTASLLVHRYRTRRGFNPAQKTEPIDAEESRLMLKALAGADWSAEHPDPGLPLIWAANPHLLIMNLGANEKDGWKPPAGFDVTAAATRWLADNTEKFRVRRYVYGPATEPSKPEPREVKPTPPPTKTQPNDEDKAVYYLTYAKRLVADGNVDKAKVRLQEIVEKFPGTKAATEAKQLLDGFK
jgi:hypothetical protein